MRESEREREREWGGGEEIERVEERGEGGRGREGEERETDSKTCRPAGRQTERQTALL